MPKKPPRETSDRVSRIASILMTALKGAPTRAIAEARWVERKQPMSIRFYVGDVRALAASCLEQRESGSKQRASSFGGGRRRKHAKS